MKIKEGSEFDECLVWIAALLGVPIGLFGLGFAIVTLDNLITNFTLQNLVVFIGVSVWLIFLWLSVLVHLDVITIEKKHYDK